MSQPVLVINKISLSDEQAKVVRDLVADKLRDIKSGVCVASRRDRYALEEVQVVLSLDPTK